MCKGFCKDCAVTMCEQEFGVNATAIVTSTFESWKKSCPNESNLALGTTIPLYLNLLEPKYQYYFLLLITVTFDPLTLEEWGM